MDGDENTRTVLDGNFDEDWGDCLFIQTITRHTELKKHHVQIRIIEAHEDDQVPFYLVSVIGSVWHQKKKKRLSYRNYLSYRKRTR